MTVPASDLADALRGLWIALGVLWIGRGWLHRTPYARVMWGVIGLLALDWLVHLAADFVERPDSNLPSDFALYSLGLLTAAAAGLGAAFAYGRWRGISFNGLIGAALLCVGAGALGGRAQYVWSAWDYFGENADAIGALAMGGMSWRGAFIAGGIALLIFTLVTRQAFWQYADAAALGLALALAVGWYTAHRTHLYYGSVIDAAAAAAPAPLQPFAQAVRAFGFNFAQDLPDAYNISALRIPVQLMTSIFYLLLFGGLLWVARRKKSRAHDGATWLAFLALSAAAGFIFGFWRGDATAHWYALRVDQWLDLLLLASALALLARRKWFARPRVQNPIEVLQHV